MAQPESDDRTEQPDPLLEFVIEPNRQEAPAVEAVPATAPAVAPPVDHVAALIDRVDQLERSVERTSKQIRSLTSQVATLVAARRNNAKPAAVPARRFARVPAMTGLIAGATAALWFWIYPMGGSLPSAAPIETKVTASAPADAAPPNPPAEPVLVKAVAAPASAPASEAPARATRARIDYQGTLSIDASPAADVFINRRPAGRTPVRLTNLRAGSHLVWIQREGFRRYTRVVQVPADRVTRVSATLDPIATR